MEKELKILQTINIPPKKIKKLMKAGYNIIAIKLVDGTYNIYKSLSGKNKGIFTIKNTI